MSSRRIFYCRYLSCSFLMMLIWGTGRAKSIYIYQLIMEQQTARSSTLLEKLNTLNLHNLNIILAYLDNQDIRNIGEALNNTRQRDNCVSRLASARLFLQTYLNKADRSMYMSFYSEATFRKMEQEQLQYIFSQSLSTVSFLSSCFPPLLQRFKHQLADFCQAQEAINSTVQSLTDPELPLTKLRKHGLGMHCNSTFQFFLVHKLLPNDGSDSLQETFEMLSEHLEEYWSFDFQNNSTDLLIIEEVYRSWFKIGYENYRQYLLPYKHSHNVIVIILALIDLLIDSFSFYIESIQDPLHAFIEFNLRYCMFRNVILSLEEKFSFLFLNYSSFCRDVLAKKRQNENIGEQIEGEAEQEKLRQMTIWHSALSKWYLYMQRHHENYSKLFFYLLKKINIEAIKAEITNRITQNNTFIELQNRLDLWEHQLLEREQIFQTYSPIEDIFDANKSLYEQLIREYIEYLVDISINQYSVHWCGHSDHVLHIPYHQFENNFLIRYQNYLYKITNLGKEVKDFRIAIDSMLSSIIQQLNFQFLKPVTLKKISFITQEEGMLMIGQQDYFQSSLCQAIELINLQNDNKDKILSHFNETRNIQNQINYTYSIVLEEEDYNMALKISASTNGTRRSNQPLKLSSRDSIMQEDFP